MNLFSKRYAISGLASNRFRVYSSLRRYSRIFGPEGASENDETSKFLPTAIKKRLEHEIRHLIESNKAYLENFIILDNRVLKRKTLFDKALKDISLRELGYDITEVIDCKNINFYENSRDIFIFDLIELLIIFSKDEYRQSLVDRFNRIFQEEGDLFVVFNFMVSEKDRSDIRSIIPLIRDNNLREKLSQIYSLGVSPNDYINTARHSADIIQFLFSSPTSKKDTKSYTEEMCKKIAEVHTSIEKVDELSNLINNVVKNSKDLSNQISNIRHTDKNSIPLISPNFYKLIAINNIQVLELVLTTFPEEYIFNDNPEDIKLRYLNSYEIDKDDIWYIESTKPELELPEIDLDDIITPF